MVVVHESTRVTFRAVALAREAALRALRRNEANGVDEPAVLALLGYCLELYRVTGGALALDGDDLEARVSRTLLAATGTDTPISRQDYARVVLHFVERLIGFAPRRARHASAVHAPHPTDFTSERRRPTACGTYSTSDAIAGAMIADLLGAMPRRGTRPLDVLDLSMEGGHFGLALAAGRGRTPVCFHGIDRDPIVVTLARRLLRFAIQARHSAMGIRTSCQDSLFHAVPPAWPRLFDAIVGNPPWNGSDTRVTATTRQKYASVLRARFDLYLAFILRADELLKPGGLLTFVLPSSFLFNLTAAPVRRRLLDNYDILTLRVFAQSSLPELRGLMPISFVARKRAATDRRMVKTTIVYQADPLGGFFRPTGSRTVMIADTWRRLPGAVFNPVARRDTRFLAQPFAEGTLRDFGRLESGAPVSRTAARSSPFTLKGIVAGSIRSFHACPRSMRRSRTARGDIQFFRLPRPESLHAWKIVFQDIRFPTHRQRIVAAVAAPGTYPISTASMFIPDAAQQIDFFEALLNSALVTAWYKVRDVNRKIKLLHLADVPVVHDAEAWKHIGALARQCRRIRERFHDRMPACGIRNEQRVLAERFPHDHAKFLTCRRAIDDQVFELFGIDGRRRKATMELAVARVF
jgi:tRNA1(Val) A37 N6-methylase TrmN6